MDDHDKYNLGSILNECGLLRQTQRHLISIETKELSDQGFTSRVLRAKFRWSDEPNDSDDSDGSNYLPESAIFKIFGNANIDNPKTDEMRKILEILRTGHNIECGIYGLEELGGIIPIPKCFASSLHTPSTRGTLVMEDLSGTAALLPRTQMFGQGLNRDQTENLLQVLSSLHAWSLNTTVEWRSVVPQVTENSPVAAVMPLLNSFLQESLQDFRDMFPQDLEKLRSYLSMENYLKTFRHDPKLKRLPTVLVHGDVQPTNILFEMDKGKVEGSIKALIDWQLAYQGCPMEDLAKMLNWCVAADVRRKHGEEMIGKYVQLFNDKISNKQHSIAIKDAKETFTQMFCFYGLTFGCGIAIYARDLPSRMHEATKVEKELIKGHLKERLRANFKDALAICGNDM